jgi:hypothetical protein
MGKRGTPSYGKQKTKSKNRINDAFEQWSQSYACSATCIAFTTINTLLVQAFDLQQHCHEHTNV